MRIYPIRYKVEFGEYTKEELLDGGWGGTDAVLIASLIREKAHEGPLSMMFVSADGTNNGEEMQITEVIRDGTCLMGAPSGWSTPTMGIKAHSKGDEDEG